MKNSCFMVGSFFAVFFAGVCAFVSGSVFRNGFNAGYDAGRADAVATFENIIDAANARALFADVREWREFEISERGAPW